MNDSNQKANVADNAKRTMNLMLIKKAIATKKAAIVAKSVEKIQKAIDTLEASQKVEKSNAKKTSGYTIDVRDKNAGNATTQEHGNYYKRLHTDKTYKHLVVSVFKKVKKRKGEADVKLKTHTETI